MARYKHIDTSPRFLAVDLERQLHPGTFEHALNHCVDLRFSVLSIEASISPCGSLRAWLKLNVLGALVLAISSMLVVPVITYLLNGFSTWSQFLAQIANNLLQAAVSLVGMVLVIVIGGRIITTLLASRGRGHT